MSTGDGAIRLFVGVRVSMATVEALTEVTRTLGREADRQQLPVRWVAPGNYHITLAFLGWTRPAAMTAIRDALSRSAGQVAPFSFTTEGLGAFPRPDKARVLWAGVAEPSGRLEQLAGAVAEAMGALGFRREDRPYHPHVTLGRLKRPMDVSTLLAAASEQGFRKTSADAVVLFESKMKSKGSEYLARAEIPLEGPSKG